MTDIANIEQGSPEWFAIRCGKVTASRISDMLAKLKSGEWGAGRKNYLAQLVAERLTGQSLETDRYQSYEMKRGQEIEPEAVADYEFYRDVTTEKVGFVLHHKIADAGASPDRLVGAEGMLELKCPNTATHIDTLLRGKIDSGYILQCQFQMACRPERKWVDFMSYDPRMPEHMRRWVERIPRDEAEIARIEEQVVIFLTDVDATVRLLSKRYPAPKRAK